MGKEQRARTVGIISDFRVPRDQEPMAGPEKENPPAASSPTITMRLGSWGGFGGRWSEGCNVGPSPWRDREQVWPKPPRTLHPGSRICRDYESLIHSFIHSLIIPSSFIKN